MVAGGISYYGLSDLILLKGTMNDFSYEQALLYYKQNYDNFTENTKELYFEQDGATSHTSKRAKEILKSLYGDMIIQNPPHSPDLAYPIETLWSDLKKRVKKRRPKNVNDLKKITLEEWNKIPLSLIQKKFINYVRRCQKVIDINGGRLEPVHLLEIRKKQKDNFEEFDNKENDNNSKNQEEEKYSLKLKVIYNQEELKKN